MTLRCKKCRYAFRVQDGLTQKPEAVPDPVEMPAHDATNEVIPLDDVISQSSAADLAATIGSSPTPEPSIPVTEAEPKPTFSFGEDYDDISDVLEKPASDPLTAPGTPPARAIASQTPAQPSTVSQRSPAVQSTLATTISRPAETPSQREPAETVRQPVTRQQLRDHRNVRQFWMLVAFLTACLLGLACWFGLPMFVQPGLGDWERKLLYSMGTPPRLLPPQANEEGELLLPPNHVKLRGDHFELADRSDNFRDEFLDGPDGDLAKDDSDKPRNFGDRRRALDDSRNEEPDAPAQRRNVLTPQQRQAQARRDMAGLNRNRNFPDENKEAPQARNVPKLPPPRNNQANRNQANRANRPEPEARKNFERRKPAQMAAGPGGGIGMIEAPGIVASEPDDRFVRRRNNNGVFHPQPRGDNPPRNPRNARPTKSTFQPPELASSDIQLASGQGIDPKTIRSISIDASRPPKIALNANRIFAVGESNRLAVYDVDNNSLLDDQKLEREVATICGAPKNGITDRPAAWILYKNGQFEKWEVLDGALIRLVSLALNPVFKEQHAVVATAKAKVAYVLEGEIVISDVLEASRKIGFTMRVPIDGQVRALRFSEDESLLVALVDDKVVRIPVLNGKVESESVILGLHDQLAGLESAEVNFSDDLEKVFVCSDQFVGSYRTEDGLKNGHYGSSLPFPFDGVVSDGERILAIQGGSRQATLFAIAEMEASAANANDGDPDSDTGQRKDLLPDGAAPVVAAGKSPHEASRSPILNAPILSIQTLPENRIAFLTQEQPNRIAIASWKNGWKITSLKLDPGMQISGFSMSSDLSKVAIWSDEVVQAWQILGLNSGQTKFISESVAHTEKVTIAKLTNDGKRIVSGDWSGNVNVSSFETGKRTGSVVGFKSQIINMTNKGDEGFVVMSETGIAKGSGNSSRDKIDSFGQHVRGANSLTQGGGKIAWFIGPNIVKVANVGNRKELGSIVTKSRPDFIRFSDDQRYLFLQTSTEISVWDWRKGERIRVFRYSTNTPPAKVKLDVADDGKTVAVVTGEKLNQISIFKMPE